MGALYENITDLCESFGVKPGKMCNEAGISRGLITDLKMGRKGSITVDTAQKIADYFGVSVDVVLKGETDDPRIEKAPTTEGGRLPVGYELLTEDERATIDALIRQLVQGREGNGTD